MRSALTAAELKLAAYHEAHRSNIEPYDTEFWRNVQVWPGGQTQVDATKASFLKLKCGKGKTLSFQPGEPDLNDGMESFFIVPYHVWVPTFLPQCPTMVCKKCDVGTLNFKTMAQWRVVFGVLGPELYSAAHLQCSHRRAFMMSDGVEFLDLLPDFISIQFPLAKTQQKGLTKTLFNFVQQVAISPGNLENFSSILTNIYSQNYFQRVLGSTRCQKKRAQMAPSWRPKSQKFPTPTATSSSTVKSALVTPTCSVFRRNRALMAAGSKSITQPVSACDPARKLRWLHCSNTFPYNSGPNPLVS